MTTSVNLSPTPSPQSTLYTEDDVAKKQTQKYVKTATSTDKCTREPLNCSSNPPPTKEREYTDHPNSEESQKTSSVGLDKLSNVKSDKVKVAGEMTLELRKVEHLAADTHVQSTILQEEQFPDTNDGNSGIKSATLYEHIVPRTGGVVVQNQVGQDGASRELKLKDEEKEKVKTEFNQCLNILRINSKKVRFWFNSDENNNPIIDTVRITDENGKQTRFNLLIDRGLKREGLEGDKGLADLLVYHGVSEEEITDELLAEIRTKLKEPTERLVTTVFPDGKLPGKRIFSGKSIGILNGNFFAQDTSQNFLDLLNNTHLKKSITSAMSDSELVDVDHETKHHLLNEYGAKAMKEIAALSIVIREKYDKLANEEGCISKEIAKREQDTTDRDPLELDPELTKKQQQLAAITEKKEKLESILSTSMFALAWHILQLNRPVSLYNEDGKKETMTTQKAINLKPTDGKFYFDKEKTKQFDPVLYRHKRAEESSEEFIQHASHETQSRYKLGKRTLSPGEKNAAVRVGAMFFHANGTESFRIRNMRYHESKNVPLAREIPGASDLIYTVQEVVKAAESEETLPEGLLDPKVGENAIKKIQDLNELTKSEKAGTNAKPWTAMTPKAAADFIRDQKAIHDNRWKVTRGLSWAKEKLVGRSWER